MKKNVIKKRPTAWQEFLFLIRSRVLIRLPFLLILGLVAAVPLPLSQPVNLGNMVNSPDNDFSPTLSEDGNTMIFNAKRNGRRYMDLYITEYSEGQGWSEPEMISELSSEFNEETPFLSADGQTLYFASDRDGSTELPRDNLGRVGVSYDIYWSQRTFSGWSPPERLPGQVNTAEHQRSPAVSQDGQTFYFTSWPFGNIEASRIMQADIAGGRFVNPRPLPAPVNTGSQDAGLVPLPDGEGYVFSSRRSGGYGGWDLYYTKQEGSSWTEPENLGPEVNSEANELHFSLAGGRMFFSSNRPGGQGLYDIYTIDVSENYYMTFVIVDSQTGDPVETDVYTRLADEDWQDRDAGRNGRLAVRTELGAEISLRVLAHDYLPFEEPFTFQPFAEHVVELERAEQGASFISAIYFRPNSYEIDEQSFETLESLVRYLERNAHLRVKIIGHTDLHGGASYNDLLSLRRARAVKEHLVEKGIAAERFEVEGRGFRDPVVAERGEPYDEQNRRTEFLILE